MSAPWRPVVLSIAILVTLLCAVPAAQAVTISPLPGTPAAMPQTQISFLGASARSLSAITVVGSHSGRHGGRLRGYVAATGASFIPSTPFTPGEHVSVRARVRVGRRVFGISTHFKVAVPVAPPSGTFPVAPGPPNSEQSFQSQPTLHPPVVTVHQAAGAASAPGYIFAAPFQGPAQWGPMIFDSAGNLVWFHPLGPDQDAADFRTQVYRGKNDLTWWEGHTIILGYGLGKDVIADANYRTVAIVRAGNGMPTDEHEFAVLPNGAALVTGYVPVQWNLSSAGGPASGTAVDCAVQEIDIRTGLVMWEWRSLGHVDVSQSYSKAPASPAGYFDYFHVNSAELLHEGNLLISARNTWGAYKVSGATGAIMWQLGGKKSTFALGPGVQFAYQHHVRQLPNGLISVFDDEGAPTVKGPSRGEFIKLDTHAKTATLVGQLVRTSGPLTTGSQGDVQPLPGGRWMVGWGGLPNFTEFDSASNVIYDAQFPAGFSYRVYRLPWAGQPLTPPAIVARTSGSGAVVYASWNGATTVASWQLLTGSSPSHMTAVSTTPRSGFETAIQAPSAAYYEVRALSASGHSLATSKAVTPSG
jgi:Arylsulfotransferase (ASST)